MKITKVEIQKKNLNRFNIYINEEFAFGLDEEIVYKYNLKKDKVLDKDIIEKMLVEDDYINAFKYSMNYLSYRARTKKEVTDKLESKDYSQQSIEKVISKLVDYGYINDKEYAKTYTYEKFKNKKLAGYRIKRELYFKGIDQDIIDDVVKIDSEDEYNSALELAKKRISSYKKDDYNKKYRKLSSYLARRGYNFSIINDVIKEVINEK